MNKWIDGMMGLVIGDACGVPVEFRDREDLHREPVQEMLAYGTHEQPKGTWSDDSSMALAVLKSLHDGYNLTDMAEQMLAWLNEARYTPFGEMFDCGITCSQALRSYQKSRDPYSCGTDGEMDNGNGSLMRTLPICLYVYEQWKQGNISEEKAVEMVHEVSAITHAHRRSMIACGLYYFCIKAILEQKEKDPLQECLQKGFDEGFAYYRRDQKSQKQVGYYRRLEDLTVMKSEEEDVIRSSGYVVDTFEAAIWCLIRTEDFESCILKAVNLGHDTDTVAAVAGGLAGLYYGYENMPSDWRECIIQKDWILELCDFSYNKEAEYRGPAADIHSHILPAVDDGAVDMEMALEMIRQEEREGITELFLTSHGDYVCDDPEYYDMVFEQLTETAKKNGFAMNFHKGCEVFFDLQGECVSEDEEYMNLMLDGIREKSYPTYSDTRYVLTEFSTGVEPAEAEFIVKKLLTAGYVPVLAHAERYPKLFEYEEMEKLRQSGCRIQINAYSLVSEQSHQIRQHARYLIGKRMVDFLGGDAHESVRRAPELNSGIQYIWNTCDEEYAKDVIFRNAERWLRC